MQWPREGVGAPVIARRDPSPVLEAAEHDLDAVAPFVATLVVFDDLVPGFAIGHAGGDALFLQGFAEPIGIIVTIGAQPLGFGKFVQ